MNLKWFFKENDFTKISLTLAFMWGARYLFLLIFFPIIAFTPLLFLILLVFTFKKTTPLFKVFLVALFLVTSASSLFFNGQAQMLLFPALGTLFGAVSVFLDFKHKRKQTLSFNATIINFVFFIVPAISFFIMASTPYR